jgi:hypothetical protein
VEEELMSREHDVESVMERIIINDDDDGDNDTQNLVSCDDDDDTQETGPLSNDCE